MQNSYGKGEIEDVAYITSEYSIADPLTKVERQIILVEAIEQARLDHPKQQWIIRQDKSNSDVKSGEF